VAADSKTVVAPKLSAAQVSKNMWRQGGLQAWRAVQTLAVTGKMDAGPATRRREAHDWLQPDWCERQAAHVDMSSVRPKTRRPTGTAAVQAGDEASSQSRWRLISPADAVQVYDGMAGWKLRRI